MNKTQPHPMVSKVRETHGARVKRIHENLVNGLTPPPPPPKIWKPKNPEVLWPDMSEERPLTPQQWASTNFPSYPLPSTVSGVVNVNTWDEKISELLNTEEVNVNKGLANIMEQVKTQLLIGADSCVEYPGTKLTQGSNWVSVGATTHNVTARIADALASFTKAGHMAGPLFDEDISKYKINPILAVKKPGGHIRVVGNFKFPKGASFNEGINETMLSQWPVTMLTASQFAQMIVKAGRGAVMSCSDMRDAYKTIPVCLKQRNLQAYYFCGALFVELKLVMGDRMACQYFDRFHDCILRAFVLPSSSFPPVAMGKTVDDIPAVAPENAKEALNRFVKVYRSTLDTLNIQAAPDDPTRTKAFDSATEGEVLGVRFDTVSFTWSLPREKLHSLVVGLRNLATRKSTHSLRELQIILGKLINIAQLCPALKTFTSEAIFMLKSHIDTLMLGNAEITDSARDSHIFYPSAEVTQDLLMVAAIMADTWENPLPILDPDPPVPLGCVSIYTDASGNIAGPTSPSLGVFFPSHDLQHSVAISFPFPTDFLLHTNGTGIVANTTTTLEALGILLPMVTNPFRCVGKSIHVRIDNIAVMFNFKNRRSNDKLAHTIIRASYLVAGALACKLFVSWIPRRSDRESIIADDLTHMDFSTSVAFDQHVQTGVQQFPPPITEWMRKPSHDRDLGHNILSWMHRTYENLI